MGGASARELTLNSISLPPAAPLPLPFLPPLGRDESRLEPAGLSAAPADWLPATPIPLSDWLWPAGSSNELVRSTSSAPSTDRHTVLLVPLRPAPAVSVLRRRRRDGPDSSADWVQPWWDGRRGTPTAGDGVGRCGSGRRRPAPTSADRMGRTAAAATAVDAPGDGIPRS